MGLILGNSSAARTDATDRLAHGVADGLATHVHIRCATIGLWDASHSMSRVLVLMYKNYRYRWHAYWRRYNMAARDVLTGESA